MLQTPREAKVLFYRLAALGAEPRDVFGLVLRQDAILAVLGIVIGLPASFALTRALLSYLPARRAMRTDPLAALRYQ